MATAERRVVATATAPVVAVETAAMEVAQLRLQIHAPAARAAFEAAEGGPPSRRQKREVELNSGIPREASRFKSPGCGRPPRKGTDLTFSIRESGR